MKSRMIPVLCLLLLFLTACQKQTSDDPVVATYKDTQILQSEVAYEKENQINVTGDKTVSDADALDQIMLNLIMLDEAEQRGLSVTQEEVDAEMAGQRKNYEEYEEVRSYIEEWCTKWGSPPNSISIWSRSSFPAGCCGRACAIRSGRNTARSMDWNLQR